MIETWLLPGPAALVTRLVTHLADGRQCLLHGAPPFGMRRALEDALALQQIRLNVVYDEAAGQPEKLLRREGGTCGNDLIPAGVWWIDGVTEERAGDWATLVQSLAEQLRQEGRHAGQRPKLVVLIPEKPLTNIGLDVAVLRADSLERTDLEVAARFGTAASGDTKLLARLRMTVAVEMVSDLLPSVAALDRLELWMAAPRLVFCDAQRFAAFARDSGTDLVCPEFELWRAQHGVLLAEIEQQRLALVRAHRERWPLPYSVEGADGRPPKVIHAPEMLELKHLCAALRQCGEPRDSPLRRRLQALRDLRNALSHLEPASSADIALLESPLAG